MITSGRPMTIGRAMPSSRIVWIAESTRSSSPSAKMTRLGSFRAASKSGFMMKPERKTKRESWSW